MMRCPKRNRTGCSFNTNCKSELYIPCNLRPSMMSALRGIVTKTDHKTPSRVSQHVVDLRSRKISSIRGQDVHLGGHESDKSCIYWKKYGRAVFRTDIHVSFILYTFHLSHPLLMGYSYPVAFERLIQINFKQQQNSNRVHPANTLRNNNVIITSKRRRFDVIITLFLRRVSTGHIH